jgi:hypothetical protein
MRVNGVMEAYSMNESTGGLQLVIILGNVSSIRASDSVKAFSGQSWSRCKDDLSENYHGLPLNGYTGTKHELGEGKIHSSYSPKARSTSGLVPRTSVAQTTPAGTLASPTKLGWQVGLGDLLVEFRLVTFSEDGDLGHGDLVEPRLDKRPDSGEQVRSLQRVVPSAVRPT